MTVLLYQMKIVCLAQVSQHLRHGCELGLITENILSPMSAKADVVVKLESP